jgi:hypothetical protein
MHYSSVLKQKLHYYLLSKSSRRELMMNSQQLQLHHVPADIFRRIILRKVMFEVGTSEEANGSADQHI